MKVHRYVDYHTLSSELMDELLFAPFSQQLGEETSQRIQRQLKYYDYYKGRQHKDPTTGRLVHASELDRPKGLDYDPTRYTTNYFKSFIERKARWQMGGNHGVSVKPRKETKAEHERAKAFENLINQLWDENQMRDRLLKAAKDRLISGRVGVKILFNPETGRLHWVFRPDTEIVPIYSDDDFEELIAVHFVNYEKQPKGKRDKIRVQTFSLDNGECFIEEAVYNFDGKLDRTIQEYESMGIDFIPVVLIPLSELTGQEIDNSQIDDMINITQILNAMNEDAIDALKFEMFSMTAFLNVPEGTSEKVEIAPGAMLEITASGIEGVAGADVRKVESNFTWGTAFDEQYARVKGSLHEIANLPNIVPQDLNFGGLNGEALHVLFHSIIQETEEHWLVWDTKLRELHEKSIRYLQARSGRPNIQYDVDVLDAIGDDYNHEINFVLPLPENRKDLVDLLVTEVGSGFESTRGAIERLGVKDSEAKVEEIQAEKQKRMEDAGLYGAFSQTPRMPSDDEGNDGGGNGDESNNENEDEEGAGNE